MLQGKGSYMHVNDEKKLYETGYRNICAIRK